MSERDKYLTEAIGWELDELDPAYKIYVSPIGEYRTCPIDFSTPNGFFQLWNWAQKQEWWIDYGQGLTGNWDSVGNWRQYINPDKFADAVHEYLKERGK